MTVKLDADVADPPLVVTPIGPLFAPFGTTAVMLVGEITVKPAFDPLNVTDLTSRKLSPAIVIVAPAAPLPGEKPAMLGAGRTTKFAALVAVPLGVVTLIGPLIAPAGTIASIWDAPLRRHPALTPLNVTSDAPVKLLPLIVTEVPGPPLAGEKLVSVGGGRAVTVNDEALVAVPEGVVTVIGPVVAVAGTVAVICVEETTVNVVALVPLNATAAAPFKLVPLIVTEAPTAPLLGEKPVSVGAGGGGTVTVNDVALVAVPTGVVTVIGPVVAAAGTVAVICVAETSANVAALPLNATAVAPFKLLPLIVTEAPATPLPGEKLVSVGAGGVTVNEALVAIPAGVVTVIGPVVAAAGTVAVICAAETTVNVAAVPLKATAVAPFRWVPLIVTVAPGCPLVGVTLVIAGNSGVTMDTDCVP